MNGLSIGKEVKGLSISFIVSASQKHKECLNLKIVRLIDNTLFIFFP